MPPTYYNAIIADCSIIAALQELAQDPSVCSLPNFWVERDGLRFVVKPAQVEGIFEALLRHAGNLIPYAEKLLERDAIRLKKHAELEEKIYGLEKENAELKRQVDCLIACPAIVTLNYRDTP